jgi:ribosomal protein L14E/L6E/L27E
MNEPVIGSVCTSRAGHDKGRAFLIVGIFDERHVLLSDGENKKTSAAEEEKADAFDIEPQKRAKLQKKFAESKEILDADVRKALQLFGYNIG